MLISPSRDVVVSLFCDSYYKSVRLGGFKFVSHHGFLKKIQNENMSASEYIILLTNFSLLYVNILGVRFNSSGNLFFHYFQNVQYDFMISKCSQYP